MKRYLSLDLDGSWKLCYMPESAYRKLPYDPVESSDLQDREGISPAVNANVPGVFEQDLYKAGVTADPYFGTNILNTQKLECMHLFYYRSFILSDPDETYDLCFEGLDNYADIAINGIPLGSTDNMLIPHEIAVPAGCLQKGRNEIFVHVYPSAIKVREYKFPAGANAHAYSYDSLYARKAPHMYGWDIMPRVLGGGMWRSVYLEKKKENRIDDAFLYTSSCQEGGESRLVLVFTLEIADDYIQDYDLKVTGTYNGAQGPSSFEASQHLLAPFGKIPVVVSDSRLWWPKNYGEAALYDVTVTLLKNGQVVDTYDFTSGIRTVKLDRTSTTDENGNGEFCFIVNGKKIFMLGSNWVPLDAFHANDLSRLPKAMELLEDVGCNCLRCWGGNVYESDEFFDACDRMGIAVWQDFSMACAYYPQEQRFYDMISEEAESVVKRLRNHPSIVLWAGDNECDSSVYEGWSGPKLDPNLNAITRQVIPEVLRSHDWTRPYLPSSPYVDEEAVRTGKPTSEAHLWGPRDYYKGSFYKGSVCHFASETGYHGCPAPSSLERFLSKEALWPWYDKEVLEQEDRYVENLEWRLHDTSPEVREDAPFAYRIRLMVSQIKTLFGTVPEDLVTFSKASQISQGEAFKYFIERFRLSKWRRTGIIWWNLLDGWPQISDAVVDYYYTKKLAYHYIKRSQQPVCFMFDEPVDGKISLYGVNDTQSEVTVHYQVQRIANIGADADAADPDDSADSIKTREVLSGTVSLADNVSQKLETLPLEEHAFYLISWSYQKGDQTVTGTNHYLAGDPMVSLSKYLEVLSAVGYDQFSD